MNIVGLTYSSSIVVKCILSVNDQHAVSFFIFRKLIITVLKQVTFSRNRQVLPKTFRTKYNLEDITNFLNAIPMI